MSWCKCVSESVQISKDSKRCVIAASFDIERLPAFALHIESDLHLHLIRPGFIWLSIANNDINTEMNHNTLQCEISGIYTEQHMTLRYGSVHMNEYKIPN